MPRRAVRHTTRRRLRHLPAARRPRPARRSGDVVSPPARRFGLQDKLAVGFLLCAIAPGGNGSNLLEIIFGGNVELGIVCTLFSSVAASIAIPLDFFVFARRFHGDNFTFASMPWLDMMLAIICVFTGAVAGAVLRYRDDALGAKLEKRAAGLGVCLLAAAVLVASVTNAKAFGMIPPKCWLAAVFPCPVALTLGYWPSRIAGLSPLDARTVATEVGEANIGVAYAILLLLYDDEDDRTEVFAGLIAYTVMNEIYIFSAAAWWRCGAPIEKPPPSPRRPSGALMAPEDAGDVEAPKGDASGLELVAMLGGGGDDGGDDAGGERKDEGTEGDASPGDAGRDADEGRDVDARRDADEGRDADARRERRASSSDVDVDLPRGLDAPPGGRATLPPLATPRKDGEARPPAVVDSPDGAAATCGAPAGSLFCATATCGPGAYAAADSPPKEATSPKPALD